MRMIDYFDRGVLLDPTRACMIEGDERRSFAEVQEMTHRIANAMLAAGFTPRSKVAVYSPNRMRAMECVLGVLRADGAWVPINARNAVAENCYILNNTDTEFLFYHSSFEDNVATIRAECPAIKHYVCIDQAGRVASSFDEFVAGHGAPAPELPEDETAVCAVFSSGGTTGQPKGVMFRNQTFETMVAAMHVHMPPKKPGMHLMAAPMTHASGGIGLALMAAGVTSVVLPGIEPELVMRSIEEHGITYLFLPPTAIYIMLAHPKVGDYDYSSLEYFIYAAAPMSVDKLKEAIDVFGPVMHQVYGQAEAPMMCTSLSAADHTEALATNKAHRLASCGRPALLTPVEIMDDDGNILARGESGEIVVRGAILMVGYYKNPEATAEVRTDDGWHRTGDIGYIDEDGFVYIVDRKKDMIISGGFNIYPSEIEQVIWGHAAVQDCAVIGVPDDKWGEAVKAVIELKADTAADEAEIIALCKQELGSVKAPKTVEFWDELPRSAVGKVRKKDIREQFWVGRDRRV